jgi:ABC-type lipoprotein export system ATPase subunit
LDNENTKKLFEILEDLRKQYNLTILCVAHDDFTKTYFPKIINI